MENPNIEYKVKSIRADDATYEKFKAIASEEFGNQGQCLSTLIGLYELEQSKATLVERKLEIDSFQMHLNKIGELFMMSLNLNQDAELRIHAEFEKLLESKDRMIIDFQEKIAELTNITNYSSEKLKTTENENSELISENLKIKKQLEEDNQEYIKTIIDKDSLNKALAESSNERKTEIEKLLKEIEEYKTEVEELDFLRINVDEFSSKNQELIKELEDQKKDHSMEIIRIKEITALEKERSLLTLEKRQQKELKELNKEHNKETKDYITKLEHLHETYYHSIDQLNAKIKELESTNELSTKSKTP